jgi:predicted transcriptional regulator of viral defense system
MGRPKVVALELSREQIIQIGGALKDRGDLRNAANVFALVIQTDRGEHRAVRGMLKVADAFLADRLGAEDALRLYRYLIEHCAGSALVDEMRRGEAAAEKRLARA